MKFLTDSKASAFPDFEPDIEDDLTGLFLSTSFPPIAFSELAREI
jgi:hypothetical protein